eukprot:TRINITY_DN2648_c0_g1_i2.p1 TRINITY_DN2648_c0_g1~~TRINITY_DN2648_c0_g1_i2.p1  ORF type:complete len:521 (+),score=156.42 TRINITY_DN2648_c0_g1_i2:376-1938(+)
MTCKTLGKLILLNLEETRANLLDKTIKLFEKSRNSENQVLRKLIDQSNEEMSQFEINLSSIIICSKYYSSIPKELKDLLSLQSIEVADRYSMELKVLFSSKEGPYVDVPIMMEYEIRCNKLYPFSDVEKKVPNIKNNHKIDNLCLYDKHGGNSVNFSSVTIIGQLLSLFPSALKNENLIDFLYDNKDQEFVCRTFLSELSEHPSFSQLSLSQLIFQLNSKVFEQKRKDLHIENTPLEEPNKNVEKEKKIEESSSYSDESDSENSPKKMSPKSKGYNREPVEMEKRYSFNSMSLLSFVFKKIYDELKIKLPKKENGTVSLGEINEQAWEKYQSLGIEIPIDNLESEDMEDLINSVKGKQIFQDQLLKILFIRSCMSEHYLPKSFKGVNTIYDYRIKVQANYITKDANFSTFKKSTKYSHKSINFQSSVKALYVLTKFPQSCFSLNSPFLPIFDDTVSFLRDYSSWLKDMKEMPEIALKEKLQREERNTIKRERRAKRSESPGRKRTPKKKPVERNYLKQEY